MSDPIVSLDAAPEGRYRIPWPRMFAEALAIVVSILLAFGIQAWWEERQDRAVEQALLTGLVEDLRQDSADYSVRTGRWSKRS